MKRLTWYFLFILLLLGVVVFFRASVLASAIGSRVPNTLNLSLTTFATGLSAPLGLVNAGDTRLFAVEKAGRIRVIQSDGTVLATPFLDITSQVDSSSNEEGLLGLAFHPNYASNGYFYVNYTNTTSGVRRSRISRFSVTADPNIADPNSEEILLTVVQPNSNHNAGHILFGPDGYLYIPLGDGGGGGDTSNNAQNLGLLLGKVVRIDVDNNPGDSPDCVDQGTGNYTIPPTNPLSDGAGGDCDEIWAIGLRNPWRSSFDRLTGDFFMGDVGQGTWEEIDFQPASSTGGENYGWRCYEGNHPFNTTGCGPIGDYTFPIFEYNHSGGNCTVIGGYVYRGSQYPAMFGRYLLLDYCSGNFWDLEQSGSNWIPTLHTNLTDPFSYVAFGEDVNGELYVVDIGGTIYRLQENTPGTPTPTNTATASPTVTATPTATATSTNTPTSTPPVGSCTVYASSDVPQAISRNGTPTVSSVLNVSGGGTIADVNVLDLNGIHRAVGELDFNLQSPAGTLVQIMAPSCGTQNNFDLNLDDEASPGPWPCPPTDGGTYQPSNPLSAFDGQNSAGTWTLIINDNANGNGGRLDGWSLEICTGGPAPTPTNTPDVTATPTPTSTPGGSDTGLQSPSADTAGSGGDGNGFELNSTNGYQADNLYARDMNSGTDTSTSCTGAGKDSHLYSDYDFTIPITAVIDGIEVRLDARTDSSAGSPKMCVQLSWDGGVTWTAAQSTGTLSSAETTTILGGTADTWGRVWTPTEFSNTNFRVRVINVSSDPLRDFGLDWVAVRVYFTN